MRTLNETVASIVGDEIGRSVMLRFYPELVRPEGWPRPLALSPGWWGLKTEERPFEFAPFMRETRLAVKIAAQGRCPKPKLTWKGGARSSRITAVIRKPSRRTLPLRLYAVGPSATDPIGEAPACDRANTLAELVQPWHASPANALDAARAD
jgi:hypothetical protein